MSGLVTGVRWGLLRTRIACHACSRPVSCLLLPPVRQCLGRPRRLLSGLDERIRDGWLRGPGSNRRPSAFRARMSCQVAPERCRLPHVMAHRDSPLRTAVFPDVAVTAPDYLRLRISATRRSTSARNHSGSSPVARSCSRSAAERVPAASSTANAYSRILSDADSRRRSPAIPAAVRAADPLRRPIPPAPSAVSQPNRPALCAFLLSCSRAAIQHRRSIVTFDICSG